MNARNHPPVFSAKLVLGLAVLGLGLILLADSLRWYDGWHLLAWWPLVLAAFGVARLVEDGPLSLRGHVWLGFAVGGFLSQFGPWGLLDRWWPAFLIWGGTVVALRAVFPPARPVHRGGEPPASPSSALSCDPETDSKQVQP